jgi:hypothetical protein
MSTPIAERNDYKGKGVLKCKICHKPYRDHQIGPCPELGLQAGERLNTEAIQRRFQPTR